MKRRGPARLVIALSVAVVLAVFLLYTSIAGGGRAAVHPSTLFGHTEPVTLGGVVVGPVVGNAHGTGGLRFHLKDPKDATTVAIVYRGTVPDPFRVGRQVYMDGRLQGRVFVAKPDTMVTKCPSKYAGKGNA